jgi:hypothetical protein
MRCLRFLLAVSAVVALSAFFAADASAQRPGGFGFGGGFQQDPISLLSRPAVRTELEVDEEQAKQIEAVRREMDAEITKSRQEISARYLVKVEKVLQPHQAQRLREITLQLRGLAALTDAEVSKKLGLSDAQLKEIASKREESQKKIQELRPDGGGFNRETFEQIREIQQETDQAILNVLSDSQKKEYETMKGKEFDRTQLFQGRGRKQRPDA